MYQEINEGVNRHLNSKHQEGAARYAAPSNHPTTFFALVKIVLG
jgi:hypothetical protein